MTPAHHHLPLDGLAAYWFGLGVVVACVAATSAGRADAVAVQVTSSGSVDCGSLESIVRDVCDGRANDEERAIALFDFVRRLVFHYPNRPSKRDVHDSLHLLNTYGYSFCSQQALLLVDLWQAAGLAGEVWEVPGHSTAQAEYGGTHHWFDPLIGAYVHKRNGEGVASLQDISADPTLLTGAEAPGLLPCGAVLRDDAAAFSRHKPDHIKQCAYLVDDATFMATLARDAKPWRWGGPTPSKYRPELTLRPGEEVEYLWDTLPGQAFCNVLAADEEPKEYWVTPDQLPPHHICGEAAEIRDAQHDAWRPYVRDIQGVRTGRYAANGYHRYSPRLAETSVSRLALDMRTPHVYTGGKVTLDFEREGADDEIRLYALDRDEGGDPAGSDPVWAAARLQGRATVTVNLDDAIRGIRNLRLVAECVGGEPPHQAGLYGIHVEAIFQHNMYARPYLVAGQNDITVERSDSLPEGVGLEVEYAWEGTSGHQRHKQTITGPRHEYRIHVPGGTPPRMLSLMISAT